MTFAFALLLLGSVARAQTIAPTNPVVYGGATLQFTASDAGTWTCPGCAGGINSATGLYIAPSNVHAQQTFGGVQLLPNNHVYNTRIDSLSVDSHSAAWIAAINAKLQYQTGFPENYVSSGSAQIVNEIFDFTPGNDGPFMLPQFPFGQIQSGWLTAHTAADHHLISVDTMTGTFYELYDPVIQPGDNIGSCPSCTAHSGVIYTSGTYNLPPLGEATDAAGTYLVPTTLHPQELEYAVVHSTTINHALRVTLSNGIICGSNTAGACGNNAAGTRHIWPATSEAFLGGGTIPYGARARLKSTFNISTFSPTAQVLLKQLQQYGVIVGDGGTNFAVTSPASGKLPTQYVNAFYELSPGIANISSSSFEFVDESGLMISTASGNTAQNREQVIFTRTSDGATATTDVVLAGVAVNLPQDTVYLQAGISTVTLTAFVNGGVNDTVTWSMAPATGTLTASTGQYLPPNYVSGIQVTTVTATSTDDPTASAQMTLVVYPAITRVLPQITNKGNTFKTGFYTDQKGLVWLYGPGGNGGYGFPAQQNSLWGVGVSTILYNAPISGDASALDLRVDVYVATGTYLVTDPLAEVSCNSAGCRPMTIENNGTTSYYNLDVYSVTGSSYVPLNLISTVTITGGGFGMGVQMPASVGLLSHVIRMGPTYTGNSVNLGSFQIVSVSTPVITSAASAAGVVGVPFSYSITATNSPSSYGATNVPSGLSLNTVTGVISGTPRAGGSTAMTMSATNVFNATSPLTLRFDGPSITIRTTH